MSFSTKAMRLSAAMLTAVGLLLLTLAPTHTQAPALLFGSNSGSAKAVSVASDGSINVTVTSGAVSAAFGTETAPARTAPNWTVGSGWSAVSGGVLQKSADGVGTATPTAAQGIVAGTMYKVTITTSAFSVGSFSFTLGGAASTLTYSTVATYTEYVVPTTTANLIITPTNTSRFTISSVSVQPYNEGFALQNTTASTATSLSQDSPSMRLTGTVWDTTTTPQSALDNWWLNIHPTSNATSAYSELRFRQQVAFAGYTAYTPLTITAGGPPMWLGGFSTFGALYNGLWLANSTSTRTASNYNFLATTGQVFFNVENTGTADMEYRVANTTRFTVGNSGVGVNLAANTAPTMPLVVANAAKTQTLLSVGDTGTYALAGNPLFLNTSQTTVPTCSSNCGTSPSVTGSNLNGRVTMGASGVPASGWVVTFNGTWTNPPQCEVHASKTGMVAGKAPIVIATNTTTFTVTTNGTAPSTADTYDYHCMGN